MRLQGKTILKKRMKMNQKTRIRKKAKKRRPSHMDSERLLVSRNSVFSKSCNL